MRKTDYSNHTRADQKGKRTPAGFFDRFSIEVAGQGPRESDMDIGGVLLVGGPAPSFDVLRDHLVDRARHVPVLGYRLVGSGREGWEEHPDFDPHDHIDAMTLELGADVLAASLDVIARLLPPDRPLWGLTMMRGYSDQEYALCYRAHHAFLDDVGVVHAASALLAASAPPKVSAKKTAARGGSAHRSWKTVTDLGFPLTPTAVDWPPFTPPLTGRRVLLTVRLDTADLRDVTAATGASAHQVCLAAITGAIREWTPHAWTRNGGRLQHRDPHVLIPLDLKHSRTATDPGNYLGLMRIRLPCGESTALTRLRMIMSQTAPSRMLRHRDMYRKLLEVLPYRGARLIIRRLTNRRFVSMVVSTLRAPSDFSAGIGTVRGLYALPPLMPGHHGMVVILQQPEVVIVSVLLDECVQDANRFPELIAEGVHRLRAETALDPHGGDRPDGTGVPAG